jgi:pyruvate, orthophosphate dikinase
LITPVLLDGDTTLDRGLIGGKAWSVNRLLGLGLPTPPAFVLTTDVYRLFRDAHGILPPGTNAALMDGIAWLEACTGRTFGRGPRPLLVSVRSGAAQSMPGMMDTVLNLGLTAEVREAVRAEHGEGFAADVQRRFVAQSERLTNVEAMPREPMAQLRLAVATVFASWMSPRAVAYREHHRLDHGAGTAVTVQAMVFGNRDDTSGTGVLFTRNPVTGETAPYGEWLARGQGEDVVSGKVHPTGITVLRVAMPAAYDQLVASGRILEADAQDALEIEYTIESGKLWLLQTRTAKRSAHAAVRIAAGLAHDGLINSAQIKNRVSVHDVRAMLGRAIDPAAQLTAIVLAHGAPASAGIASGLVVGDSETAEIMKEAGIDVVLARQTTDPNDVQGMIASVAVVTELGGSTSHAAVVSRELGRPCVVGCGADATAALLGEVVTVDGGTGQVYQGLLPTVEAAADDPDLNALAQLMSVTDMGELLTKLGATPEPMQ